MRFVYFILALVGATSHCHAQSTLKAVDKKYTITKEQCIVETMPSTRNQGGLGICYAAAAATLLDEYKCYRKNNNNCTTVPDSERFSMLDLARFSQNIEDQDEKRDRSSYRGLRESGSGYMTMLSVWYTDSVVPLDCVSDNALFLNNADPKTADSNENGRQGALWEKLKTYHAALQGRRVAPEEAAVLKRDYILRQNIDTIQEAFSQRPPQKEVGDFNRL